MSVGLSVLANCSISALVAEPSLIQVSAGGAARCGVDGEACTHLGHVQRTRGQVLFLVGHEDEVAAVGGVVAHQRRALVGHDLDQLVRDAAHAEMLLDAGRAVHVDSHFGHVAVVVGVGLGLVAIQVLAEGLQLRIAGGEGVGLVLFAGQMGAPGRQAGAAGDPQAVHLGGVHVVVLDQAELARGLVLVQRQHGDGRGQLAVHVGLAILRPGRVFELHHGEHGLALDAIHLGIGHGQQRGAVGRIGEEVALAAGHGAVDDLVVVDVVVAAGQDLAALAVRHFVAGHEEGLVAQVEALLAVVAVLHLELRGHGHPGHGLGGGQRGRGHGGEAGRHIVLRGTVIATAAGGQQAGGGHGGAERQQGAPVRNCSALRRESIVDWDMGLPLWGCLHQPIGGGMGRDAAAHSLAMHPHGMLGRHCDKAMASV